MVRLLAAANMKTKRFFLLIFLPVVLVSCSDSVGPGTKPYLNISGNYPVFLVDSTGGRWMTDSTVLVQLSDGSNFRLVPGVSSGYADCFSWVVDDSLDAPFHHVVFHVNWQAVERLTPANSFAEADYQPMVLNTTDFLSMQQLAALVAIVDSTK